MGVNTLKKLAVAYIENGCDLRLAMKMTGYNISRQSITRMEKADRFRAALKEECGKILHRARVLVAKTGRGLPAIEESMRLYRDIVGEDPPGSETLPARRGESDEDKDQQLPDSAW